MRTDDEVADPSGDPAGEALATPLVDVQFCVVDLETTGGSAVDDAITEVGAVRVRGGEITGTLQTLVDARAPVPPRIAALTGIHDGMLHGRPPIEAVLPSLLEFARGCVVVGHNIGFDVGFLDASLDRHDHPLLLGPHLALDRPIDTLPLARRLLRDDTATCRLGDLAATFGFAHRATHRALDDAHATVELLHLLLERAAGYGVETLGELFELPRQLAHPQAAKLRLTTRLPRRAGVWVLHGGGDEVLRAAAATDVRADVRALFASTDRRRVAPMLRELQRVAVHDAGDDGGAALVAELVAAHAPRYQPGGPRRRRARTSRPSGTPSAALAR